MYIILQDSRENKGMNLALIDRSKNSDKWWTSVLENAKIFTSKLEADEVCSKYKFNNPRVVPFDVASKEVIPIVTIKYQRSKPIRKNIFQMNMYEYKEWLGYSDAIEYGGGMFE